MLAAALIRRLNQLEIPAVGVKPIEVGCTYGEDHDLMGIDGPVLRAAGRVQIPPLVASPYRFASRASPARAAEQAGLELTLADLVSTVEAGKATGLGSVVLEGPGGPKTPLTVDGTTLDLAARLQADVFLVGAPEAGAESEILLALHAAGALDVRVKGVLLTQVHPDRLDPEVHASVMRWSGLLTPPPIYPPLLHQNDPIAAMEAHLVQHQVVEPLLTFESVV